MIWNCIWLQYGSFPHDVLFSYASSSREVCLCPLKADPALHLTQSLHSLACLLAPKLNTNPLRTERIYMFRSYLESNYMYMSFYSLKLYRWKYWASLWRFWVCWSRMWLIHKDMYVIAIISFSEFVTSKFFISWISNHFLTFRQQVCLPLEKPK